MRGSDRVSGISTNSSSRITCEQSEVASGVSRTPRPTSARNHWRASSMRLTTAMGDSQIRAVSAAISSKSRERGVSRMP